MFSWWKTQSNFLAIDAFVFIFSSDPEKKIQKKKEHFAADIMYNILILVTVEPIPIQIRVLKSLHLLHGALAAASMQFVNQQ